MLGNIFEAFRPPKSTSTMIMTTDTDRILYEIDNESIEVKIDIIRVTIASWEERINSASRVDDTRDRQDDLIRYHMNLKKEQENIKEYQDKYPEYFI